jgi:hypothetical protein
MFFVDLVLALALAAFVFWFFLFEDAAALPWAMVSFVWDRTSLVHIPACVRLLVLFLNIR